ncbi:MAG: D-glycero-beta-D-manno-heptose-7-phosphate kinase [Endomicrobiales bacterium]|nr:D-glycero-beta-D-manno-heptose-7-phosphate kinase [Endomicrobiales bacterium]
MEKLLKFIPNFSRQRILVIGDLMMDKFIWGRVSRISPEAPVPVVEITRESQAFGGAGNVANNIISLGGRALIVGVVGDDFNAEQLRKQFKARNIDTAGIVADGARPTIMKMRIIAQNQQVVRVDKELKGNFEAAVTKKIVGNIEEFATEVDGIIISDYGKGVITKPVLQTAIKLAKKRDIPVTVDPKPEHFLHYKNVSCITPNLKEAVEGMKYREVSKDSEVVGLGKRILKRLGSDTVLITRGEKGMTLFEPGDKITDIPTRAKEVFDVTGAGDTVISALTLALAAGARHAEAAEISNFAAGIVVGKIGTATASPQELREAITGFHKRT